MQYERGSMWDKTGNASKSHTKKGLPVASYYFEKCKVNIYIKPKSQEIGNRLEKVYNKCIYWLVAQKVKNLPAMQETWIQSQGREDPLEKGMATYSSILVWRIPWTEDLVGYSPWGITNTHAESPAGYLSLVKRQLDNTEPLKWKLGLSPSAVCLASYWILSISWEPDPQYVW